MAAGALKSKPPLPSALTPTLNFNLNAQAASFKPREQRLDLPEAHADAAPSPLAA